MSTILSNVKTNILNTAVTLTKTKTTGNTGKATWKTRSRWWLKVMKKDPLKLRYLLYLPTIAKFILVQDKFWKAFFKSLLLILLHNKTKLYLSSNIYIFFQFSCFSVFLERYSWNKQTHFLAHQSNTSSSTAKR